MIKQRDHHVDHIKHLRKSLNISQLEKQFFKNASDKLQKICSQLESDNVKMKKQEEELQGLISMNEKDPRQYTDKLENEKLTNKVTFPQFMTLLGY